MDHQLEYLSMRTKATMGINNLAMIDGKIVMVETILEGDINNDRKLTRVTLCLSIC